MDLTVITVYRNTTQSFDFSNVKELICLIKYLFKRNKCYRYLTLKLNNK